MKPSDPLGARRGRNPTVWAHYGPAVIAPNTPSDFSLVTVGPTPTIDKADSRETSHNENTKRQVLLAVAPRLGGPDLGLLGSGHGGQCSSRTTLVPTSANQLLRGKLNMSVSREDYWEKPGPQAKWSEHLVLEHKGQSRRATSPSPTKPPTRSSGPNLTDGQDQ